MKFYNGDAMKNSLTLATGVIFALLVLTSIGVLAGAVDERGEDSIPPFNELNNNGRYFEYNRDTQSAYLSSMITDEDVSSFVNFYIEARSGLYISYSAGFTDQGIGQSMYLDASVLGLIEFEDLNENSEYDPFVDEIVSTHALSDEFYYLDFISDVPDEPDIPDSKWNEGYSEGYATGYKVGYAAGQEDLENGNEFSPDPWEYFPELKDLFFSNSYEYDEWNDNEENDWDDTWEDDWEDEQDDIPIFEIVEEDDGSITIIMISADGTIEEFNFSTFKEFEEWLMEQMSEDPGMPPEDPGMPPEDPDFPPIPDLEPYREGYLFGLIDGFFQGYMEGYGMEDGIFFPTGFEEDDIWYFDEPYPDDVYDDNEGWGEYPGMEPCPECCPVYGKYYDDLEAPIEMYDQSGYQLGYSVKDIDGIFEARFQVSGPLVSNGVPMPTILGLEMIVDYPYTMGTTQVAVIMETSSSFMAFSGNLVYCDKMIGDWGPEEKLPQFDPVPLDDMEFPEISIPWRIIDNDGGEIPVMDSIYYKELYEWEDLFSKGKNLREGHILSLTGDANDHEPPQEDTEPPREDEQPRDEVAEDQTDPPQDLDDDTLEPDDENEQLDTTPSSSDRIQDKGSTSSSDVYIGIGVILAIIILVELSITGVIAYKKLK